MPNAHPDWVLYSEEFLARVGLSQGEVEKIVDSAIFDERFYVMKYPDIAEAGINPFEHYLVHGRFEKRKPSAVFDPVAYAEANPEVVASGMEPFLHYVLIGKEDEAKSAPWLMKALGRADTALLGAIQRIEATERRLAVVESLLDHERGRIDFALGGVERITVQIDAYHAYRETGEYRAAYATAAPLVSVCVTTMDRSDLLLERAIASVLAQSYRNLQIVVVGDNCTDDTMQRLAALTDSRIQFVNLPERGPYPRPGADRWCVAGTNAVNHALSLCEGHFITHLDDDDSMAPHRIESILAAALQDRADFLWHAFWYQHRDRTWTRLGNGRLEHAQVTTGSIFYHRYFARFPWDIHAYRLHEPGDWNRIRKIRLMRPRLRYVDEPLLHHYAEQSQSAFVARVGERFLE